jgi:hypothetical protein
VPTTWDQYLGIAGIFRTAWMVSGGTAETSVVVDSSSWFFFSHGAIPTILITRVPCSLTTTPWMHRSTILVGFVVLKNRITPN